MTKTDDRDHTIAQLRRQLAERDEADLQKLSPLVVASMAEMRKRPRSPIKLKPRRRADDDTKKEDMNRDQMIAEITSLVGKHSCDRLDDAALEEALGNARVYAAGRNARTDTATTQGVARMDAAAIRYDGAELFRLATAHIDSASCPPDQALEAMRAALRREKFDVDGKHPAFVTSLYRERVKSRRRDGAGDLFDPSTTAGKGARGTNASVQDPSAMPDLSTSAACKLALSSIGAYDASIRSSILDEIERQARAFGWGDDLMQEIDDQREVVNDPSESEISRAESKRAGSQVGGAYSPRGDSAELLAQARMKAATAMRYHGDATPSDVLPNEIAAMARLTERTRNAWTGASAPIAPVTRADALVTSPPSARKIPEPTAKELKKIEKRDAKAATREARKTEKMHSRTSSRWHKGDQ